MLESGVYSSVLTYNDGFTLVRMFLKKHDIKPDKYFWEGAYSRHCLRVENMDQKALKVAKDERKNLRAIRKGFVDKDRENEEGDAYPSGHL